MGSSIVIRCSNCYEDNRKETYYELLLGRGMMCFKNKQLRDYYDIENNKTIRKFDFDETPVSDESINKIILDNLKKGYSFTDHFGYIPYYCETCNNLLSLFHFQMKLNDNYYIPKYHCYKCKNSLEPINIIWEKTETENEEDQLENIGIKYRMYIRKDNTIKIVSENNEEKKLICGCCNNNIFIIDNVGYIDWD
jgi:hypothetical protein